VVDTDFLMYVFTVFMWLCTFARCSISKETAPVQGDVVRVSSKKAANSSSPLLCPLRGDLFYENAALVRFFR